MATPTKIGENPNDKMPAGKPLHPDRIVSEDDAGSAAMQREEQEERGEPDCPAPDADGEATDLVNAGKFTDPASKDDL